MRALNQWRSHRHETRLRGRCNCRANPQEREHGTTPNDPSLRLHWAQSGSGKTPGTLRGEPMPAFPWIACLRPRRDGRTHAYRLSAFASSRHSRIRTIGNESDQEDFDFSPPPVAGVLMNLPNARPSPASSFSSMKRQAPQTRQVGRNDVRTASSCRKKGCSAYLQGSSIRTTGLR